MKKKIETLQRENRILDQELEELEQKRKKAKQAFKVKADEAKTEFLRAAAIVQRELDAYRDETKELEASCQRSEAEVEELRRKLKDQSEAFAQHRARMEADKAERIKHLHKEVEGML